MNAIQSSFNHYLEDPYPSRTEKIAGGFLACAVIEMVGRLFLHLLGIHVMGEELDQIKNRYQVLEHDAITDREFTRFLKKCKKLPYPSNRAELMEHLRLHPIRYPRVLRPKEALHCIEVSLDLSHHQKQLGLSVANAVIWGTLASNIVPGFAILGLGCYLYLSISSCFSFRNLTFMSESEISNKHIDHYTIARQCRKVTRTIFRCFSQPRDVGRNLLSYFEHPLARLGFLVGGTAVLYHIGPAVIPSKIAEAVGLNYKIEQSTKSS